MQKINIYSNTEVNSITYPELNLSRSCNMGNVTLSGILLESVWHSRNHVAVQCQDWVQEFPF